MTAQRPFAWRGWAAALLLLLAAAGGYALLRDDRAPAQRAAPQAEEDPVGAPVVPQPDPLLDRAALIDAASAAASAFAAGAPLDDVRAALAGRRFRLELPLGCAGPAPADRALEHGWRLDDDGRTLRIGVARQSWGIPPGSRPATAAVSQGPGSDATTSEPMAPEGSGFAIARPWITTSACPVAGPEALAEPDRETIAIVEPVDPDQRGNRGPQPAYRADVRIAPEVAPVAGQGLRIVIDGRLSASGLPPIVCRSEGANRRPTCLFVARFEAISVTGASGDPVHAEWRS
jgi:hypothetical protein